MREIKLRFYDRRNNIMLYDIESTVYPDGSVGCDMDSEWCIYAGQFTGLKDKNGVEIYDGDILQGNKKRLVVVFNDGCFKTEFGLLAFSCSSREIIGNIHLNPELLNK